MATTNSGKPTKDPLSRSREGSQSKPESKLAPDVPDAIKRLVDGEFKNVIFMVGAGISTAAGIPDFRTPGTGLYSNLEKLDLPFAEAVFDIDYLRERPEAFYTLAKDMNPKQFEPTAFHKFIKWVDDQGYLRRCYTQNIDTLERQAGVRPEKIIEAHGSFHGNHCIECHEEFDHKKMDEVLSSDELKIPKCEKCDGVVKPDIVFFGESLPSRFFEAMDDDFDNDVDLVIVAGTSLQVQPFAQLPDMVHKSCPRVLFNMEKVGSLGKRAKDALVLGDLADVSILLPFLLSDNNSRDAPSRDVEDNHLSSPEDEFSEPSESSESGEVDSISGKLNELEI
ncbi:NAD-dependent protein deacetylase sirtuin-2 [Wickerhamiella sorbophila]|uniref:NAD-dependent protein deacetylase sirtuin-2 n=1 Tax=Wickerhamiella sorbophila TaxID=45607 RepID=A0A2T0FBQ7_9ASCO|nr:NAD-dependent protein deacetylase sirtuin-2 [Wickerhamiella sorbophila]PRT52444.1 NAD-dependent protein deacetylase sirtuin-2 [Wickerhamiella sorbophila]